ncbi:MAG: hypothetical protein H0X29_11125, partial [Parachlamydiaceae bacterium]|nr:hypothetical protein [Parachlamydiaceae bacterium]
LKEIEPLVQSGKISQAKVQQFKQMIEMLETTEMLPTWLTLFFSKFTQIQNPEMPAWYTFFSPSLTTLEKFEKLLETIPVIEAPFINYFLDLNKELKECQGKIDLFNHPKSFENGWLWLQNQVSKLLSRTTVGTDSLVNQLKKSSPISKMVALKVMQEFVNTYDLSIKAMKASSAWSSKEQVKLFKRMLDPYLKLLVDWTTNIADPGLIPMHRAGHYLPIYLPCNNYSQICRTLILTICNVHLISA